jgi:hypothetical protein
MRLRITAPEDAHFKTGQAVHVFLDDKEVSKYVKRIVLEVDASEATRALITMYADGVDVDVPSEVIWEAAQ